MRFAFAHVNSVPQRINEINEVLLKYNVDIFGLAETRLKPDTHFVGQRFPGYSIYRHDRSLRGGGGVALICKSDMCFDFVSCSSERLFQIKSDIPAEYCLFLVSSLFVTPILVLVVYRPPCSAHFSFLMDSVGEFTGVAPRVMIMGDFNYNLADPLSSGQQLVETFTELNFQVLRFGNTFFYKYGLV